MYLDVKHGSIQKTNAKGDVGHEDDGAAVGEESPGLEGLSREPVRDAAEADRAEGLRGERRAQRGRVVRARGVPAVEVLPTNNWDLFWDWKRFYVYD